MEHEYQVVGSQPVRIPNTKEYAQPDTTFYAEPTAESVKFMLDVGAIKETGKKREGAEERKPFNTDASSKKSEG